MEIAALPRVDEHATVVSAEPAEVWHALGAGLDRSFARPRRARCARLVGATGRSATGRPATGPGPLRQRSTLAGFRVAEAVAGHRLVLVGGHRLSSYALIFRLGEAGPGRTRLSAETRAVFPGRAGGLYRRLVIGTGAHGAVVRRMLAKVRRRAESR